MVIAVSKLAKRIEKGELSVNPILDWNQQAEGAKIDLRLDNEFWIVQVEEQTHHDTREGFEELFEKVTIPYSGEGSAFILHPGEFVLAKTFEYVDLPVDLLGRLGGRSSLARQGIVVHATASVVDPGYTGRLTLELTNFGSLPVKLYPRQRVAAITFEEIDGESESYDGKFGGEGGPETTETDEDISIVDIEI
jgi:dCTP deaminase